MTRIPSTRIFFKFIVAILISATLSLGSSPIVSASRFASMRPGGTGKSQLGFTRFASPPSPWRSALKASGIDLKGVLGVRHIEIAYPDTYAPLVHSLNERTTPASFNALDEEAQKQEVIEAFRAAQTAVREDTKRFLKTIDASAMSAEQFGPLMGELSFVRRFYRAYLPQTALDQIKETRTAAMREFIAKFGKEAALLSIPVRTYFPVAGELYVSAPDVDGGKYKKVEPKPRDLEQGPVYESIIGVDRAARLGTGLTGRDFSSTRDGRLFATVRGVDYYVMRDGRMKKASPESLKPGELYTWVPRSDIYERKDTGWKKVPKIHMPVKIGLAQIPEGTSLAPLNPINFTGNRITVDASGRWMIATVDGLYVIDDLGVSVIRGKLRELVMTAEQMEAYRERFPKRSQWGLFSLFRLEEEGKMPKVAEYIATNEGLFAQAVNKDIYLHWDRQWKLAMTREQLEDYRKRFPRKSDGQLLLIYLDKENI